ncbi:MAG: MDR family MFS transporter [Tumebacillaceae bacterium]
MALFNGFVSKIQSYPKILWLLGIGCFLNIGALSFLWPLNSIYIHVHLGKPLAVSGFVLLLNSAGGSIGQLLGGTLFDRIGARPVLLLGLLSSATIIALPGLISSWPLYVTVMCLFGFTASLSAPAMYALASRSWPQGGRRAFNFLYVANNLGVAVGTAIGGVIASHSFHLAFLSASCTFLIFLCFVFAFIRDPKPTTLSSDNKPQSQQQAAVTDELAATIAPDDRKIPWLPVGALFVGCVLLWVVYVQWQASVSVHMQDNGIPLTKYSVLWTLNGLVIFLGQPLISAVMRVFRTFASQIFLGSFLYLCVLLLLISSNNYSIYIVAMVILTLGEMLLWPVIPAAVAQLSPPSRLGFLQGFIGSAATVGRMLGPLIGGLLYDNTSFHTLLLVMMCILIVPVICFTIYAKTVNKQRAF